MLTLTCQETSELIKAIILKLKKLQYLRYKDKAFTRQKSCVIDQVLFMQKKLNPQYQKIPHQIDCLILHSLKKQVTLKQKIKFKIKNKVNLLLLLLRIYKKEMVKDIHMKAKQLKKINNQKQNHIKMYVPACLISNQNQTIQSTKLLITIFQNQKTALGKIIQIIKNIDPRFQQFNPNYLNLHKYNIAKVMQQNISVNKTAIAFVYKGTYEQFEKQFRSQSQLIKIRQAINVIYIKQNETELKLKISDNQNSQKCYRNFLSVFANCFPSSFQKVNIEFTIVNSQKHILFTFKTQNYDPKYLIMLIQIYSFWQKQKLQPYLYSIICSKI